MIGGRRAVGGSRSSQVLLGAATGLLVLADTVAAVTARRVGGSSGCGRSIRTNLTGPILLAVGGFVLLMALVGRLATGAVLPSRRRGSGLFFTAWVFVALAFAASALAIYVAGSLRLCG